MTAPAVDTSLERFHTEQQREQGKLHPLCPSCRQHDMIYGEPTCFGGCDLTTAYRNWADVTIAFARLKAGPAPAAKPATPAPAPTPDALTRTSPDGRSVVTVRRQPRKTTPLLSLHFDGVLVASEELAISREKARAEVVGRCPEPCRAWLTGALLELSEAWSTTRDTTATDATDATPSPVTTTDPWPEPVALAAVLDDVQARVPMHLYVPAHVPAVIALWCALTHAFLVTEGQLSTPLPTMPLFWGFSATKGCGKSRTLALLHVLSARAFGSENCSTSAAFRIAAKYHAALFFDEVDTWLAEDTKREFVGFLNASFTRGGMFTRVVGDDHDVKSFPVFGPRAFAGIGTRLADATRSRCVRAALQKKPPHISVAPVSTTSPATAQWANPLRSRLATAVAASVPLLADMLEGDGPTIPPGVEDRSADAWRPLLALAEVAGDHWPDTARAACLALTRQAAEQDEDEGDIGVRLLWDVAAAFREGGTTELSPEVLQAALTKDTTAPWADYRAGQAISTRAMAVLLRRFGIKSRKSGSRRFYALADLSPALASYPEVSSLPPVEVSQASEVSRAPVPVGTDGTDKTLRTLLQTERTTVPEDDPGNLASLEAEALTLELLDDAA